MYLKIDSWPVGSIVGIERRFNYVVILEKVFSYENLARLFSQSITFNFANKLAITRDCYAVLFKK